MLAGGREGKMEILANSLARRAAARANVSATCRWHVACCSWRRSQVGPCVIMPVLLTIVHFWKQLVHENKTSASLPRHPNTRSEERKPPCNRLRLKTPLSF